MFQAIDDLLEATDAYPKALEILATLERDVRAHFRSEETLMTEVGYPALAAHRGEHAGFLARELPWIRQTFEGSDGGGSFELTRKMAELLRHWTRNHIETADADLAQWLRQHDSSASKDGAVKS